MRNIIESILNKKQDIGGKQDRLSQYIDPLYLPYVTLSNNKIIFDVDALNKAGFTKSEIRLGHITYLKGKVDNMFIRPLPGNAPTIKFKWDKVTGGIKYVNSKDDGLGQNFFLDKQTIYNRPINLEFAVPPRYELDDTGLKQLLEDNKLTQKIPYERLFYFINNLGERGFLIKTKKSNFNPSDWNMELIDESGILYSKPKQYGEFYYRITNS